MKVYFDGPDAQLCIEAENDLESSMLKLWHAMNNSGQYMYSDVIDGCSIASLRIVGVTDKESE